MIVHHHALIVATVRRLPTEINCADLRVFLSGLVKTIGMQSLFDPIAIDGKYGFTGIVGIVTSHIAFHFFDENQSLQFDVYSCKEFDLDILLKYIDEYWKIEMANILFIKRDRNLEQERFSFTQQGLVKNG